MGGIRAKPFGFGDSVEFRLAPGTNECLSFFIDLAAVPVINTEGVISVLRLFPLVQGMNAPD